MIRAVPRQAAGSVRFYWGALITSAPEQQEEQEKDEDEEEMRPGGRSDGCCCSSALHSLGALQSWRLLLDF